MEYFNNEDIQMIEDNIYTYLSGIAALTTLLNGDLIKWPSADINNLNGISYKLVSDPNLYESDRRYSLYRFYINNQLATKCQSIGSVLKDNFHECKGDVGGIYVNWISQETNIDPFQLEDGATFQKIQDYRFTIL